VRSIASRATIRLAFMLSLWRSIFYYVLYARWQIRLPRQSQILIFDGTNSDLLLPLLRPWNPEVLYLRGEVLNLYCLARSVCRWGMLRDAYIDSYVEAVRPELVITLFDNDMRFYALSTRHPTIKTLFIQNGWRSYYADIFERLDQISIEQRKLFHVDYMLVFNRRIGDEYARYISGKIVTVGSIKNNVIRRSNMCRPEVLAFISQYNEGGIVLDGRSISHNDFFKKPDAIVLGALLTYARANEKHLVIIPRYQHNQRPERKREEAYYREMIDGTVEFLETNAENPSYAGVDMVGVSVAIDTTLGYESLARGNRTAIFSVRGKICGLKGYSFGWPLNVPETGFFWTNRADVIIFTQILDRLYSVTNEAWKAELSAFGVDNLMCTDPGNSILKHLLNGLDLSA
jgi:surface carbohydrate biosynthesis protein